MKTRVIELSVNNRKEVIELPINPPSVEFTEKQLNQAITLLNIGEANLKGERGLKYTKLSSLDNFIFENTSTGMTVSFDCTSIYGSNTILVPVREVRV